MVLKLDFSDCLAAQDMIRIIERDKSLDEAEAIRFAINETIYKSIMDVNWASIALSSWGHDDPDREWEKIKNPHIEIELDDSKYELVNRLADKKGLDLEIAVSYFLIFTMDSMGYHI